MTGVSINSVVVGPSNIQTTLGDLTAAYVTGTASVINVRRVSESVVRIGHCVRNRLVVSYILISIVCGKSEVIAVFHTRCRNRGRSVLIILFRKRNAYGNALTINLPIKGRSDRQLVVSGLGTRQGGCRGGIVPRVDGAIRTADSHTDHIATQITRRGGNCMGRFVIHRIRLYHTVQSPSQSHFALRDLKRGFRIGKLVVAGIVCHGKRCGKRQCANVRDRTAQVLKRINDARIIGLAVAEGFDRTGQRPLVTVVDRSKVRIRTGSYVRRHGIVVCSPSDGKRLLSDGHRLRIAHNSQSIVVSKSAGTVAKRGRNDHRITTGVTDGNRVRSVVGDLLRFINGSSTRIGEGQALSRDDAGRRQGERNVIIAIVRKVVFLFDRDRDCFRIDPTGVGKRLCI